MHFIMAAFLPPPPLLAAQPSEAAIATQIEAIVKTNHTRDPVMILLLAYQGHYCRM